MREGRERSLGNIGKRRQCNGRGSKRRFRLGQLKRECIDISNDLGDEEVWVSNKNDRNEHKGSQVISLTRSLLNPVQISNLTRPSVCLRIWAASDLVHPSKLSSLTSINLTPLANSGASVAQLLGSTLSIKTPSSVGSLGLAGGPLIPPKMASPIGSFCLRVKNNS